MKMKFKKKKMIDFKPEILYEREIEYPSICTVKTVALKNSLEKQIPISILGVDPGTVNLGLAIIIKNMPILTMQVRINRDNDPVSRILNMQRVMSSCINTSTFRNKMIIEAAGYGSSPYRQSELAEIRASITLWGHRKGYFTDFVAPNKIRKAVFGSGKIASQDVWLELPPDAGAALACALYYLTTL